MRTRAILSAHSPFRQQRWRSRISKADGRTPMAAYDQDNVFAKILRGEISASGFTRTPRPSPSWTSCRAPTAMCWSFRKTPRATFSTLPRRSRRHHRRREEAEPGRQGGLRGRRRHGPAIQRAGRRPGRCSTPISTCCPAIAASSSSHIPARWLTLRSLAAHAAKIRAALGQGQLEVRQPRVSRTKNASDRRAGGDLDPAHAGKDASPATIPP